MLFLSFLHYCLILYLFIFKYCCNYILIVVSLQAYVVVGSDSIVKNQILLKNSTLNTYFTERDANTLSRHTSQKV